MSLGGSADPPRQTMGVFPTPIWMQTLQMHTLHPWCWPPMQTSLDADPPGCRPPLDTDPQMQTPGRRPLVMWPEMHAGKPTPPCPRGQNDWQMLLTILPSLAVGKDTFCNQVSTRSNLFISTIKTSTLPSVRIPPSGPSFSDEDNFTKCNFTFFDCFNLCLWAINDRLFILKSPSPIQACEESTRSSVRFQLLNVRLSVKSRASRDLITGSPPSVRRGSRIVLLRIQWVILKDLPRNLPETPPLRPETHPPSLPARRYKNILATSYLERFPQ